MEGEVLTIGPPWKPQPYLLYTQANPLSLLEINSSLSFPFSSFDFYCTPYLLHLSATWFTCNPQDLFLRPFYLESTLSLSPSISAHWNSTNYSRNRSSANCSNMFFFFSCKTLDCHSCIAYHMLTTCHHLYVIICGLTFPANQYFSSTYDTSRVYTRHFICVVLFNPHNSLVRYLLPSWF